MTTENHSRNDRVDGFPLSRRDWLKAASCGFGYAALAGLCAETAMAGSGAFENPLAIKTPHFKPRAKRVIFLFMQGGPSQVDTFDYKEKLTAANGKKVKGGALMAAPWKFSHHGQSGLPIADIYPELGKKHADSLCLVNSMHTDSPAHPQATIMAHTGSINFVRPSLGAWTLYGLGTENESLPGFVAINPLTRLGGAQNYGSSFLPACFQGTPIGGRGRRGGGSPGGTLPNISNARLNAGQQRRQVDLLQAMNRDFSERSTGNSEIDGVIESYELAFRMQDSIPTVMDLAAESEKTLAMYGIESGSPSAAFGRQCLMARRFAESGVRYIEISHNGWDHHNNLRKRLAANAAATDKAIAGLLTDLKQRGLFEDTLVIWGGEFGRTPAAQGKDGRRHNNRGYSIWMAGGGIRGGIRYGATDEFGDTAVENRVHIHDLHATMLHCLGLDHEKLTYRYAGRDFRLTDVYGNVVHDIMA